MTEKEIFQSKSFFLFTNALLNKEKKTRTQCTNIFPISPVLAVPDVFVAASRSERTVSGQVIPAHVVGDAVLSIVRILTITSESERVK